MINIRQAQKNDVSMLTHLARQTYADTFGDSMEPVELAAHLEANLSESHIELFVVDDVVLIAEFEGQMIGFVHFSDINIPVETPTSQSKELQRLYVRRDFQNRGIGSSLMDAALAHPLLKEAEYIYLDVWEHNSGAQRLYKRYGFEVIGERRFTLPSGLEGDFDYIMVRQGQ